MVHLLRDAQATSTPVESPQPVFWISLLTELSREMQLPQQQGMQVSFKEQSGCCRFFQKAVFFPFVAHSLRRLEYLLNAGPALDAELGNSLYIATGSFFVIEAQLWRQR